MNHNQADKLITDHGDYLTRTEVSVFRAVLAKVDFRDCSMPAFVTPRLAKLASGCRVSERTTRRALNHLGHHGWLTYEPANGRGHRAKFQLVPRTPDPTCRCPKKGDTGDRLSSDKGGHQRPRKGDISDRVVAGQDSVCTNGREGEGVEGWTSLPDNVVPIRRPLTRADYPSTWCDQADLLWAAGYDR